MQTQARASAVFVHPAGLSRLARVLLIVMLVVSVAGLVARLGMRAKVVDPLSGQLLLLLHMGCAVAAFVVFLWWQYVAYGNLIALGKPTRFGRGWVTAFYFLPILSFFRPLHVVRELCAKSASPVARGWRLRRIHSFRHVVEGWWVSLIAVNVAAVWAFKTPAASGGAGSFAAPSYFFVTGAWAVLTLMVISFVDEHQAESFAAAFGTRERRASVEVAQPFSAGRIARPATMLLRAGAWTGALAAAVIVLPAWGGGEAVQILLARLLVFLISLWVPLVLTATTLWLLWIYRAFDLLRAAGQEVRFRADVAVILVCLPLINLISGYMVLDELSHAAAKRPHEDDPAPDMARRNAPLWLIWWWLALLLNTALVFVYASGLGPEFNQKPASAVSGFLALVSLSLAASAKGVEKVAASIVWYEHLVSRVETSEGIIDQLKQLEFERHVSLIPDLLDPR